MEYINVLKNEHVFKRWNVNTLQIVHVTNVVGIKTCWKVAKNSTFHDKNEDVQQHHLHTKAMETYSNFANIVLLASSMMKKPIVRSIDI
jgi:7-cyano-7-deazaguanine synthase in queuosine biosynthesis